MEQTVYLVTRLCVTGVTEYQYFRSVHPIGRASALVMPRYPVTVQLPGLTLRSERDIEQTIFPGCRNSITCVETGTPYATSIWQSTGDHILHTPLGDYLVRYRDGLYTFHQGNTLVAAMRQTKDGSRHPTADGWEPHMVLMVAQPISDTVALLFMTYPLYQVSL